MPDAGNEPSGEVDEEDPEPDSAVVRLTDAAFKHDAAAKPAETPPFSDASSSTCIASTEICDGKDNDCDGQVDEDAAESAIGLACSNGGQGSCAHSGKQVCRSGLIVCDAPQPEPSLEVCDGRDNDCDGIVDNIKPVNLIRDPGFEGQVVDSIGSPWDAPKGVYVRTGDAKTGDKSVVVVGNDQNGTTVAVWNNTSQQVKVEPGRTYKFSAWVKTSPNTTYGRIGARALPDGITELSPQLGYAFSALNEFTYVSTFVVVPEGITEVDVYVGINGPGAGGTSTMTVDDVVMISQDACAR